MTAAVARPFVRRTLLLDAAATGATGLLLALAAGALAGLLGLPAELLRWAGVALVPFAALLVVLARRPSVPTGAVWAVVACNALWAADSALLLVTGWVDPTALGVAFVLAQAAVVAAFALVQSSALRRPGAA